MKHFCKLTIIALIFASCEKKEFKIADASWLAGSWEQKTDNGVIREIWKKQNDSVFAAYNILTTAKDSVYIEWMEIRKEGNDVFYYSNPAGQNAGKEIAFKLTAFTETSLAFENPQHDFPQKIVYTKAGDSLIAIVSAVVDGKERSERFAFVKK